MSHFTLTVTLYWVQMWFLKLHCMNAMYELLYGSQCMNCTLSSLAYKGSTLRLLLTMTIQYMSWHHDEMGVTIMLKTDKKAEVWI
jgi:hypothetical protein